MIEMGLSPNSIILVFMLSILHLIACKAIIIGNDLSRTNIHVSNVVHIITCNRIKISIEIKHYYMNLELEYSTMIKRLN